MSVCQYYLRGNCRYGDRCRSPHVNPDELHPRFPTNSSFRPRIPRHPINPNYRYVAPNSNYQNHQNHHVENRSVTAKENSKFSAIFKWAQENFADKKNQEKALDILGEMQREAKEWQKSEHLWRFTSNSLFPGGQPLPDWHDQSFEEIKWAHRQLSNQNQEHVYKKAYNDYYENIVRYLNSIATLKLDKVMSLKDYISQYVASNHKPSKTLPTDVEMKDIDQPTTLAVAHQPNSTNFTPDDQLLEDERAAFQRDTFEFGQIPIHAPSQQFC